MSLRATAPSIVRVIFSQTKGDYVTASLRHSIGPLIVGEWIAAYEIDEPSMWAWAKVVEYDSKRRVALIEVDRSTLVDVEGFDAEAVGGTIVEFVNRELAGATA